MTLGLAFAARVVEERYRFDSASVREIRQTFDADDTEQMFRATRLYFSAAGLVLAAEAAARKDRDR